jgi:hypothetical protein
MIDNWAIRTCEKPSGSEEGKDNAYGYGVPLVPAMVRDVLGVQPILLPAQSTIEIVSAIFPIMALAMVSKTLVRRM